MKCKQCKEGNKLWQGITYESLLEEYQKTGIGIISFLYTKLIPFTTFSTHRKYCHNKDCRESLE